MIAFVMSGGANRGALEAGALLALLEAGIQPDILVGTSAGSLNAMFIATDPTLTGAQRLAEIWKQARRDDFFPGSWLTVILRLLRGQSLFSSDSLRRSVEHQLPPDKRRFGDLSVKLYITAANLTTSTLYLYGDQPDALLIDAVMASTAHPLAYPAVHFRDWLLVDGGVIANVPVGIAVDKGATEIYVLNVGYTGTSGPNARNVFEVLNQSINMMMYQHFVMDLKYVLENTDVNLHHIPITGFENSPMWELSQGKAMVQTGYRAAQEYLQAPHSLASIPEAVFGEPIEPEPPAGAQVYFPASYSPCDVLGLPPPERQITTYLTRYGPTDPAKLSQALGRTAAQVRIDLATLTKKGIVQCLADGKAKIAFGRSRRRIVPDQVWNALSSDQNSDNCFDKD